MTTTYSAPKAPFIALIVLLVSAGLAGLVVLNTAINTNSFQLHEQKQHGQKLAVEEEQLERDVAKMDTPSELDAQARGLGLVPAGTPGFINLSTGEVIGKPTPAGSGGSR